MFGKNLILPPQTWPRNRLAARRLPSPTACADDKADEFTQEKAMKLATEHAQKRKLNWGDAEKAEKKDADTFWVFFKTPEKEEKVVWKRTLVVKRDGKVSLLPRR
jgi:hypothetical protein